MLQRSRYLRPTPNTSDAPVADILRRFAAGNEEAMMIATEEQEPPQEDEEQQQQEVAIVEERNLNISSF